MSETTSTLIVRIRHIRAAKLCGPGARAWFEDNGLSWRDFLKSGISADTLIATGDPLAARAVDAAQEEIDGGR